MFISIGVEVCQKAWAWAHGFANATFNRVRAKYNQEWRQLHHSMTPTVSDAKVEGGSGGATHTASAWILRWIILATHNPPNALKPSVPKIAPSKLWDQYCLWCVEAKEDPIEESGFRGLISVLKGDMEVCTLNFIYVSMYMYLFFS